MANTADYYDGVSNTFEITETQEQQGLQIPTPPVPHQPIVINDIAWIDIKVTRSGDRILKTKENLEALMNALNFKVTFDCYQKTIKSSAISSDIGDDQNLIISELKSQCERHGLNQSVVDTYLSSIAQKTMLNPPLDWLKKLSPPQNDPIRELANKGCFNDPDWAYIALKRWLIQTVETADYARETPSQAARAKFESVLVLMGEQGKQKTTFIRNLLPKSIGDDYFLDGMNLDLRSKDSEMQSTSAWIVELGELDATFKKSDIASLKAFLSKTTDVIRLPYAKAPSRFNRQTSFIASVNEQKFLMDATGNRRFLPLEVLSSINLNGFDYESLWGYVWGMYLNGEQWWLTSDEEVIQLKQLAKFENNPMIEAIYDRFTFESEDRQNRLTALEVAELLGMKPDRGALTKVGNALKKIGAQKIKRHYLMPKSRKRT